MTSTKLKNFVTKIKIGNKTYRIIYNIIAIIIFLEVSKNVPSFNPIIFDGLKLPGIKFVIFILLLSLSVIIGFFGIINWNLSGFLGLSDDDDPLKTQSIYKLSRHPVYLAALIAFIAGLVVEVNERSLSWLIGAGGYFVIGTIFEENKLEVYFEEYTNYKTKVGRFVPWRKQHIKYLLLN